MSGSTRSLVVDDARRGVTGGRVAIFDLDRTLLPVSSLAPLVRALAAAGMVDRRQLVRAGLEHAVYRRRGSSDAQVERVRHTALAVVAGLERERVLGVAEEVAGDLARLVSPGARLLLSAHLDAGDFCVLLSASPQELVERIGRRLGFHRAVGTRAELVDDRYTVPSTVLCATAKRGSMRSGWRLGRSTWVPRSRMPIRHLICRCCGRAGSRWRSTPTAP